MHLDNVNGITRDNNITEDFNISKDKKTTKGYCKICNIRYINNNL